MYSRKMPHNILRTTITITTIILCISCHSVNHLRNAQDNFNKASESEWKNVFEPLDVTEKSGIAPPKYGIDPRTLYASALTNLETITYEEESTLKKYQLWGSVLVLKSLCLWKLGSYDDALRTAEQARKLPPNEITPRDMVVSGLIPGLVSNSKALDMINRYNENKTNKIHNDDITTEIDDLLVSGNKSAIDVFSSVEKTKEIDNGSIFYIAYSKIIAISNHQNYHLISLPEKPESMNYQNFSVQECNKYIKKYKTIMKTINESACTIQRLSTNKVSPEILYKDAHITCTESSDCSGGTQ